MRHVTGDAIKVDGGWAVEIPSCGLRVWVVGLSELDERVGVILGRLNGSGRPESVVVNLRWFRHPDDHPSRPRRRLVEYRYAATGPAPAIEQADRTPRTA